MSEGIIRPVTLIDWDNDSVKHYVRRNAWLAAASSQAREAPSAGRLLRYLTCCAEKAIDVFMFLREGILCRTSHSGIVKGTYFCEMRDDRFANIGNLIGAHEQGFLGPFEKILLFEDYDETQHLQVGDRSQRYAGEVATKMMWKHRQQRLRSVMLFDILNLDLCGAFFPPSGGIKSPTLRSIERLLDWQTEFSNRQSDFDSFVVFLTTHVEEGKVNSEAMEELIGLVHNNSETEASFLRGLEGRFGTGDVRSISGGDFRGFYCLALPKLIIGRAFERGWEAEV